MPKVLAEKRVQPSVVAVDEPLTDIKAEIMTPGGGVVLAVTISLTLFFLLSVIVPRLDGLQTLIVAILTLACWAYLLNCSTERLQLTDDALEYRAFLGRTHRFELDSVHGFRLTDMGVSLSGSMFILEINLEGRARPVQISLGPCWQRRDLVRFLKTLGQAVG